MFSFDYTLYTVLSYTPLGGLDRAHFYVLLPIPAIPPYVVRTQHIHGVQPSELYSCYPLSSRFFVAHAAFV